MKQTLIDIRGLYVGREPTVQELADVIKRRLPPSGGERDCYLRGLGVFIGQAVSGLVLDPDRWEPPE